MRRPLGVALFNAIFPGVGYLFLKNRQKRLFGLLLVLGGIASMIWIWVEPSNPAAAALSMASWFVSETPAGMLVELLTWVSIAVAFGYDGYQEAKKEI